MQLTDPAMTNQPPEARDFFLSCYTVSLAQGETLNGTLIKHSTIKNYLTAACEVFGSLPYTSDHKFVATILKSIKAYEEVPKRRRMITDGMMQWLITRAQHEAPDSAIRAIVDWIILGRYAGFRAAEWSQTQLLNYKRITDWPGQPSLAFTRNDFGFLGDNERHLTPEELSLQIIRYLSIRWRKQKNGDNGQKVTFGDDLVSPDYSASRAGFRIYERSIRLGKTPDEPMAVFRDSRGKVKFITDTMVNDLLRDAARAVLGLRRGDPELKLWSTHSIRVTAANLLYRQQLSDQYIMTRLRWKSPAFLVYLRNTIYSADSHSAALSVKLTDFDKQHASYRPPDQLERLVSACCPPAAASA